MLLNSGRCDIHFLGKVLSSISNAEYETLLSPCAICLISCRCYFHSPWKNISNISGCICISVWVCLILLLELFGLQFNLDSKWATCQSWKCSTLIWELHTTGPFGIVSTINLFFFCNMYPSSKLPNTYFFYMVSIYEFGKFHLRCFFSCQTCSWQLWQIHIIY